MRNLALGWLARSSRIARATCVQSVSSRIRSAPSTREPESLELRLIVVSGIVVVDADAPASKRPGAQQPENVAFQDRVAGEAVAAQVRLE